MFKGKLIVVTGLDGSGTTSLCKALSETDPNGMFLRTPNGVFDDHRPSFTEALHGKDTAAHYLYYLAAIASASHYISGMLNTHNVYCNRYLIDTVVSHRAAGLNVNLDYNLGFTTIIRPDLTIFVDIDEATRQERLANRGKSVLDLTLDNDDFRRKFKYEFTQLHLNYSRVNNDGDFNLCYETAMALVQECLKTKA